MQPCIDLHDLLCEWHRENTEYTNCQGCAGIWEVLPNLISGSVIKNATLCGSFQNYLNYYCLHIGCIYKQII